MGKETESNAKRNRDLMKVEVLLEIKDTLEKIYQLLLIRDS